MRILMISLDKSMLGIKGGGDAIERHKRYGQFVEGLDVIVFNKGNVGKNKISENVTVWPTNSLFKLNYIFKAYKIGKEICQQKKIDLIDVQDPFFTGFVGYLLKKKFKIPLEVHCHGDFFDNKYWLEEKFLNCLLLLLGNFLIKKADAIRAVSEGIKKKLEKLGISENKIKIISTPVDLKKFENIDDQKVKEIKGLYENKKIILFVGTLNKVKNLPLLLDALKIVKQKFKHFVCLIIGEGKEFNNLKLQIANLKLEDNVKLLGSINHNDLVNYYGVCDFLVLPSLSESFGKVILEAAGAGKPAIATQTTGASELIIDGETGFLVPINNKPRTFCELPFGQKGEACSQKVRGKEKLAEKIYFLLNNQDLNDNLGRRAKEYIKNKFNQEESIKKIVNFWQEIISR